MSIYDHLKPAHYDYVSLFSGGADGWGLAARNLGLVGTGLEIKLAAVANAKANGMHAIGGDLRNRMAYHNTEAGLIASPPCQSLSVTGKQSGLREIDKILTCLDRWSWEGDFSDPRTALVLEPLRWILSRAASEHPYRWIAMEQVPTCLPIWQGYAKILDEIGYFVWTGVLPFREWIPQSRKRTILMAHRDRNFIVPIGPGGGSWGNALGYGPLAQMISNYGTGGDSKKRGIRWGDGPSFTVTSKILRNRIVRFDGGEDRLSLAQAGILQGFPADWHWPSGSSEAAQQIGDAMCPPVAQAILEALVVCP